jgi:uncharacterized protein (DUF362 family)
MDRRDFCGRGVAIVAGWYGAAFFNDSGVFGADEKSAATPPDLVAVRDGEPDVMFDEAIAAIGGIGSVVKKGQVVVVKPNIGWDKAPETGANTNPLLVKRIVEHCVKAGAKKVYVFDHTCHGAQKTYQTSQIKDAAESVGGVAIFADDENDYKELNMPKASTLKTTKVHKLIIDCDVLIDVPVLKHHSGTGLTMAMKNLMGAVWDRGFYHKSGLHECIADFCLYRKPDLNVVDAYRVTMANGPQRARAEDVKLRKSLLLSRDIVAVDAAAAKLFGSEPAQTRYIKLANDMGIGTMALEKLNIKKITIKPS